MTLRARTDLIVFHCSATRGSQHVDRELVEQWHRQKGWTGIGYHFVIRRDGQLEQGRKLDEVGAHVQGHNLNSVGVCMAGGLDESGKGFQNDPAEFTPAQWKTARALTAFLRLMYPTARVVGHRDLSPDQNKDGQVSPDEWLKTCPGFDAAREFAL